MEPIAFVGFPAVFNSLIWSSGASQGFESYCLSWNQVKEGRFKHLDFKMVFIDMCLMPVEPKKIANWEIWLSNSGIHEVVLLNTLELDREKNIFSKIAWKSMPFNLSQLQLSKWIEIHLKRIKNNERLNAGNFAFNPANWSQVYDISNCHFIQLSREQGAFLGILLESFEFNFPLEYLAVRLEKQLNRKMDLAQIQLIASDLNFRLGKWSYGIHYKQNRVCSLINKIPWSQHSEFEWQSLDLSKERVHFEKELLSQRINKSIDALKIKLGERNVLSTVSDLSDLLNLIMVFSYEFFKKGQKLLHQLRMVKFITNDLFKEIQVLIDQIQVMATEQIRLHEQHKKIS